MTSKTSIMVQPPAATDLWQIADLWAAMQEELAQTVAWRRSPQMRTEHTEDTESVAPTASTPEAPTAQVSASLESQKAAYEKQLREWYRDPAVFMLVGMRMMGDERAGQVVAFMVSRMEDEQPRYGRLIDLYVQPSLRGNDLARHMVEAASGWMRAQKCEFLEANTLTSNRRGMAFLASTQFQLHSSVLRKRL